MAVVRVPLYLKQVVQKEGNHLYQQEELLHVDIKIKGFVPGIGPLTEAHVVVSTQGIVICGGDIGRGWVVAGGWFWDTHTEKKAPVDLPTVKRLEVVVGIKIDVHVFVHLKYLGEGLGCHGGGSGPLDSVEVDPLVIIRFVQTLNFVTIRGTGRLSERDTNVLEKE